MKGVYGVDEGDEAQWHLSAEWAEEGWVEEEYAGAVYDEHDETIGVFLQWRPLSEPAIS